MILNDKQTNRKHKKIFWFARKKRYTDNFIGKFKCLMVRNEYGKSINYIWWSNILLNTCMRSIILKIVTAHLLIYALHKHIEI